MTPLILLPGILMPAAPRYEALLAELGNAAAASGEMQRVDSMLANVEALDGRWTAPIVGRARLGYRQ